MTKYINVEKLKAEIERMREINKKAFMSEHIREGVFHGRTQAINHLLAFLDTLEVEDDVEFIPVESTLEYKIGFADGKRELKDIVFSDDITGVVFQYNDDLNSVYLSNVSVKENLQGNGFGNAILQIAEQFARNVNAKVIVLKTKINSSAFDWYCRHGYIRYEDDGDYCWMRKEIAEEKDVELPEQPVITKSNALFDKCVENCDPAVMKEVSDNIDKMLGRQPLERLEEFRKEVIKFSQDHFDELHGDMDTIDIVHIIACHFVEWQKVQDQKTIELAEDHAMLAGMNKMEQQIVSIIESRIKEIIGDAQPNPVLRIELQGIIDKIK